MLRPSSQVIASDGAANVVGGGGGGTAAAEVGVADSVDEEGVAPSGAVIPAAGAGAAVQLGSATNGIIPKIQNVVATVNLDCKLDLTQIANGAKNCDFNPRRFCAVIMRIREPKATAMIFASGKMVCTGNKSEEWVSAIGLNLSLSLLLHTCVLKAGIAGVSSRRQVLRLSSLETVCRDYVPCLLTYIP